MAGRGGTFSGRDPIDVAKKVREEEQKIDTSAFEMRLSGELGQLLASFNDRDAGLIRDRLDRIKAALERNLAGTTDMLFGGSVKKHTYVDGLSDVDSLLILNDTGLADRTPQTILDRLSEMLMARVERGAKVRRGTIALTIEYEDGMTLQCLPALRIEDKLRVPAWRGNEWSTIDPNQFADGLTKRNQECGGKVVPTIKLAKAINATLPEGAQLTGYHIESIAIAAFRGYGGEKTTVKMLPHFFEAASSLVLKPITDRSGQSVHVDEYLGPAGSEKRQQASHVLQRIAKRMKNASAAQSVDQWLALFGE